MIMTRSSAHNIDSGGSPRKNTGSVRQKRSDSLQKQERREQTVVDLPNISFDTAGTHLKDDTEGLDSRGPKAEQGAEQERYDGRMQPVNTTTGSYNYVGLGLTQKLPGSVARARAIAESRLKSSNAQHPSLRERHDDSDAPKAPSPGTITFAPESTEVPSPCGKWRCCKCKRGHAVYSSAHGQHPVSVLSCVCAHRSCSKCTLEGLLKQFVPMSEPEVVPLSEDKDKAVRFGVFCDGCGLSWRAQEVHDSVKKEAVKSALLQVSGMHRRLTARKPHPLERIRASRSMSNLRTPPQPSAPMAASKSVFNLRALSNEMKKEHGEQADLVSVKFTGVKCTCGMTTDATSLCFQIVDPPKDFHKVQFAKQMAGRRVAGFGSTPEDKARGHGTPMLTLKGCRRHPNPLMSNPIS